MLSTAGHIRNFCLLDVMLEKTDASPPPSDGWRCGTRYPKVMVYNAEGAEGEAETADSRL